MEQHKCIKCGKLFLPAQGENIAQCKKCAVKDCKRFIDKYLKREGINNDISSRNTRSKKL
jgi:predicted  nucleic acid-binding Zn-ribbon protein